MSAPGAILGLGSQMLTGRLVDVQFDVSIREPSQCHRCWRVRVEHEIGGLGIERVCRLYSRQTKAKGSLAETWQVIAFPDWLAGWAKWDGSLYWDGDRVRWWESSIFMVFVYPSVSSFLRNLLSTWRAWRSWPSRRPHRHTVDRIAITCRCLCPHVQNL